MAAPTLISELSQTIGSNGPDGSSTSPSELDNYQRAHAGFIAQLRDGKGLAATASVASATTTDIGAVNSLSVEITGTTTITGFGTTYSGPRFVRFAGALTLTHSSSLSLPGAANITTAAGDTCIAVPNLAGSGWNVASYQQAVAPPAINGPTFSAYRTVSGDAVARITFVKVNFDGELWDKGSCFAASEWTPNIAGYYQINAGVEVTAAVPGFATIYKNGAEYKRGARTTIASAGTNFAVSGLVYCNGTTDAIAIYFYHDHTTSTTLIGGPVQETWFDGHFVRGV